MRSLFVTVTVFHSQARLARREHSSSVHTDTNPTHKTSPALYPLYLQLGTVHASPSPKAIKKKHSISITHHHQPLSYPIYTSTNYSTPFHSIPSYRYRIVSISSNLISLQGTHEFKSQYILHFSEMVATRKSPQHVHIGTLHYSLH